MHTKTDAHGSTLGMLSGVKRTTPPVPRKIPRQERATVTVDAMITAVERVLDAHGAAGLTTNRVAEVAGVSVGTLYHYFPNKESLVGALQERVLQQLLAAFRLALAGAERVPIATVAERIGAGMIAVYRSQRPMHRWLIELRTSSAYQERFRGVLDVFTAELASFLSARPELALPAPAAVAFALVHAVEGIAAAVGSRPGAVDADAVMREGVNMVIAFSTRWHRPT